MSIPPVVLHMIVCDRWVTDPDNNHKIDIHGWTMFVRPGDAEEFPLFRESLTVFLWLTGGRGKGDAMIVLEMEDSEEIVCRTPVLPLVFHSDPLHIVGVPIELHKCYFPRPGRCLVQFWYDDLLVHETSIRVRP